jgi:hypothetical protein
MKLGLPTDYSGMWGIQWGRKICMTSCVVEFSVRIHGES